MKRADYNNGGFGIPDDYEKDFSSRLKARLVAEDELKDYPALRQLKGKHGMELPEGYFENTDGQLLLRIARPQNDIFRIPQDYFEKNRKKIKEMTLETDVDSAGSKKTARVIFLFRASGAAIAAMLLVVLSMWMYRTGDQGNADDCETLACLDASEVINSRALDQFTEEELLLLGAELYWADEDVYFYDETDDAGSALDKRL